jgi:hypothetical protein
LHFTSIQKHYTWVQRFWTPIFFAAKPPSLWLNVGLHPVPSHYLLRKSRRNNSIKIFSASIADIDKMLKPKVPIDPCEKFSTKYHNYLNIFNRILAERLLSFRPDIDYKIILEKNFNGKDSKILWKPLYNMSRGELLILRKTLTKLLNKNFIRASSSPASASILFVKKFNEELYFYIDYCTLNTFI